MPVIFTDEAQRKEVAHAKKELRARRKDGADNWLELGTFFDEETGVETMCLWNSETDQYAIKRRNHLKKLLLDQNHAERMENQNQRTKGSFTKIASIPMDEFWNHFGQAHVDRDWSAIKRKLNDPDFAAFRTWKGRV